MYILELTNGFPFPENPMLGCFEFDQAKALASLGNKVITLSLDLRSFLRKRKYGLSVFEKDGVKIYNYSFPVGNVPNFIIAFLTVIFAKRIFRKIQKADGKPDIIHAHFCYLQGCAAAKLKKKFHIPLVITEHSSELIDIFYNSRHKYFAYGYENADKIISVGTALQNAIQKRFNCKSVVVPNIVDLSVFTYSPKEESKCFPYIAVGSAIYGKGFDILLKAFARLNDDTARLTIVGDGSERSSLEKLVKELGIQNQVKFTGLLPRKQIEPLIKKSKVFILTSRFETFGIVYIEALATGTPVIATRCGGPEDIVTEENGLLVDVDNVEQTAEAMKKIKQEYNKYDGADIAMKTKQSFGAETIAKLLENEFNNLEVLYE